MTSAELLISSNGANASALKATGLAWSRSGSEFPGFLEIETIFWLDAQPIKLDLVVEGMKHVQTDCTRKDDASR